MILEQATWTAIPHQFDADGRLQLSIHLGPRLVNDDGSATRGTIRDARMFSDWPRALQRIKFRVEFANGTNADGRRAGESESALWRRLFPPGAPLVPFVFQDHSARDFHSFPARDVHRFIRQTYAAVAAEGAAVPSIDDPFGPLAHFGPLEFISRIGSDSRSYFEELVRARQQVKGPGRVVRDNVASGGLSPSQQATQNAFYEAYRFYRRPGSDNPDLPTDYVEPPPAIRVFDFHQRVALFADHPRVLRLLGLVVDIVVDLADPFAVLPPTGLVRVVPEGDTGQLASKSPFTVYKLDRSWFGARPERRDRVTRGLLHLDPRTWELFQVDVDGAALQAIGFADTLSRLRNPDRRNHATPAEATVPALRSGGLSLALTHRADALLEDLRSRKEKNGQLEGDQRVALNAEDLIRGYRIDVRDAEAPGGPRWHSLHARISDHESRPSPDEDEPIRFQVADEGYVKASSASSEREDHPSASDDLYLHETVFGWDGWSLSAPRPGKSIVEPGEGENGSSIDRFDPASGNGPLITRMNVAPRTLPRMRIGHRYRLRARTVDLAGNSRPFSERDLERETPTLQSEERTYFRVEPVPSPVVLRRHLDTEGESLETLAIRSDAGDTAATYAASAAVRAALTQQGAAHTYAADSQRHLAPPKGSQQLAEHHGEFDDAFGGPPAAATAALRVALREEGTFLDNAIVDVATGQKTVPQTTIQLVPAGTMPPQRRGDGLAAGAYAVYPDASVMLPYLPDPLAAGVSLTGYDYTGTITCEQVALFDGPWPTLQPIRLRVSEGALSASFQGGVLDVTLPQAEVVYVRLSSVFPADRLDEFAIWDWTPAAAKTPAFREEALQGKHWMLTPFRSLTLVHAVQRPLAVPDMTRVRSSRPPGSTFVDFGGPIANHAKSTGRLDVLATWTEDVDLVTEDAPRMRALGTAVAHAAHAYGFDIEPTEDQAEVSTASRASRHELGDTKHRRVTYHSVATTRFREFLPRPIADDQPSIERVEATADAGGTPRAALVHNISSSARPAAPDVLYVVPTFRWERQEGSTSRHTRRGKSVRVWLRRPWFSSGDDEQLAVVLRPYARLPFGFEHLDDAIVPGVRSAPLPTVRPILATGAALHGISIQDVAGPLGPALRPAPTAEEIRKMLMPYVSDWGSDPAWRSADPTRGLTPTDFPKRTGDASDLTLDELDPVATVTIAAHDVRWEPNRKLWFCDIELDAGDSYFPFVRLALARYQPHSVAGAHLSRVTMTDFIQLAPDRTAELSIANGRAMVTVRGFAGENYVGKLKARQAALQPRSAVATSAAMRTVAGIAATAGPLIAAGPPPSSIVRVALQRQAAGVADDLGWATIAETELSVSAAGFFMTWSGSIAIPDAETPGTHRLLLTESEPYIRTDLIAGDPKIARSPADFTRERVVYADTFELAGTPVDTVAMPPPVDDQADIELEPYAGPAAEGPDWSALPALVLDPSNTVNGLTKLAQAMLNATGDAATPLRIDGKFGPLTTAAVTKFRARTFLPPGAVLDPLAWMALALAAPYPHLEAGIGAPPMEGPAVGLAQRLLNLSADMIVAPITDSYDDETTAAVAQFQRDRGLEESGAVDQPTWLALFEALDRAEATGAERVVFTFDRAAAAGGGDPFTITERVALEGAPTPTSDSLENDWLGRSGFWLELQDSTGLPIFRRILGPSPDPPMEVKDVTGAPMSPPGPPTGRSAFTVIVPTIAATQRLCLFGNINNPAAAALLLQNFEPWLQ